jgi:hypothetical protein
VDLIPDEVIEFFNLSNPSSRAMILEFTQSLTEMSISKAILLGDKARHGRKTDNLTSIYEPIF